MTNEEPLRLLTKFEVKLLGVVAMDALHAVYTEIFYSREYPKLQWAVDRLRKQVSHITELDNLNRVDAEIRVREILETARDVAAACHLCAEQRCIQYIDILDTNRFTPGYDDYEPPYLEVNWDFLISRRKHCGYHDKFGHLVLRRCDFDSDEEYEDYMNEDWEDDETD